MKNNPLIKEISELDKKISEITRLNREARHIVNEILWKVLEDKRRSNYSEKYRKMTYSKIPLKH